jgi:hypothetical protein
MTTIERLKELEPRLIALEKLCKLLSTQPHQEIIEMWPILYHELYACIGWGRDCEPVFDASNDPILFLEEAWGVAYSYFFDLARAGLE